MYFTGSTYDLLIHQRQPELREYAARHHIQASAELVRSAKRIATSLRRASPGRVGRTTPQIRTHAAGQHAGLLLRGRL
jgi:hypothetical protein